MGEQGLSGEARGAFGNRSIAFACPGVAKIAKALEWESSQRAHLDVKRFLATGKPFRLWRLVLEDFESFLGASWD